MGNDSYQNLAASPASAELVWRTILPPLQPDCLISRTLKDLPRNPAAEDKFFSAQPPKVVYKQGTNPAQLIYVLESFSLYQEMLSQIQRVAPERFKTMHKGTPYYLMGWLAFAMKDYEKAVFFMDAALSEDLANNLKWENTPASSFLMISDDYMHSAAPEIAMELRHEVDEMMQRYSRLSPSPLTTREYIDRFIKPNASDQAYRSIITSLNTFVLERKDRLNQIKIRSENGGSIEPFLTHLFKGALIFESILKRKINGKTLGECLDKGSIQLGLKHDAAYKSCREVSLEDLKDIFIRLDTEPFHELNIAVTYALRNTAGHDLGWTDIFSYSNYDKLTAAVENSILWAVQSLYCGRAQKA